MVIRISIGLPGSGKTVTEVRNIGNNPNIVTYSNIITKYRHQINLNPDHIISEEIVSTKKGKDGQDRPVKDFKVNFKFWKEVKKPVNVVLDEAHSIMNSRRAMSKVNVVVSDWLALIRKVVGSSDRTGELVLITQLPNRIDVIARDMATQVNYNLCHYTVRCKCGNSWYENSDTPESFKIKICPHCDNFLLKKLNHTIEVWCFPNMVSFVQWKEGYQGTMGRRPFYDHFELNDVGKYFNKYDTYQIDNLFSDKY